MAGIVHETSDKDIVLKIENDAVNVAKQLVASANLHKGQIVVVGCSTSETVGKQVGSWSVPEIGEAIYRGLNSVFAPLGIFIAAQCCEHLNRAIIVENEAVIGAEIVNVKPKPKAGGSFATAAYNNMKNPVALETIKADAGIDIGGTLIGMHLKQVAVPIRLQQKTIGEANIITARVRPKFIGGERAIYDEKLKDGYPDF